MSGNSPPPRQELWQRILLWSPGDQGRVLRYSLFFILSIAMIWGPAIAYLKLAKPVFTSKWTLILPGTGINTSVNLENIGQATTSSLSPYGGHSVSPKINYKTIAESSRVIERAAEIMAVEVKVFGEPRIKLVDQTSMIFFEVKGDSPDQAQKKSYALYEALEAILTQLRADEIKLRENSVQVRLGSLQAKLKKSRDDMLAYQLKSGLVSAEQFNQLAVTVEQIKLKLVELITRHSRLTGERNRLVQTLDLNAKEAANALKLNADPILRENMQHYAQADSLLARQTQKMGKNHPEVIKARDTWQAAKRKLAQRMRVLIGKQDASSLSRLIVSSDESRGTLFEHLILLDAESKGIEDKIFELKRQLVKMEDRLHIDAEAAAVLDDLKRNHQIAEAVFSAALARIDTGKSDIYASYPLIQILNAPNVPQKPTSPNPLYVYLGAGIATFLNLFAILILWIRKPWLQKILLNA